MAVRKRGKKWVADFYDQNGQRRTKTFERRKDAFLYEAEARRAVEENTYVPPRDIPPLKVVAREWFGTKTSQRPSTVRDYRTKLKHIVRELGNYRLNAISVPTVENFRDHLLVDLRLAPSTTNAILGVLSQIFQFAMRRELVHRNPVKVAERARNARSALSVDAGPEDAAAEKVLTPEELKRLLAAARPGFERTFLMTAIFTGARVGELTALTWDDVDFTEETITICRSVAWHEGNPEFNPPKTRSGMRSIKMAPTLAKALQEWKLQCPTGPLGKYYVFPTDDGSKPKHRRTIAKQLLKPALRRASITKRITLHDLRHTAASILITEGVDSLEVARYLGHANPQITLQIYAHWYNARRTQATMAVLEHVISKTDRTVVNSAT